MNIKLYCSHMQMLLNNRLVIFLYVKVWLLHIFIYYTCFGFCYQYDAFQKMNWSIWQLNFIGLVLFSPVIGVIGFLDGMPGFILSLIGLMILLNRLLRNFFWSYMLSIILGNMLLFLFFFMDYSRTFILHD